MSVRLIDIARRTGFSVSTVSRVLNNKSHEFRIKEKTKRKIKEVAEELGYRPNKLARSLKLNKTFELGIIVPDLSNPFFATLVKSISKEARRVGFGIMLNDSDENVPNEERAIQTFIEKRVDGFVIAPVGLKFEHINQLATYKIPTVVIDRCFNNLDFDSVGVDNFKGAYLGVKYLIGEGHRKIAFIQGIPGTFTNDGRLEGYKRALEEAEISYRAEYIVGDDFRALNGYLRTKTLLNLDDPPTAIFAASDLIVLGVYQAIKEEKKRIPQDVSVVSFDDPFFASYLSPPLTAIQQPIKEMGIIAVKLLLERIENNVTEPRQIFLKPNLVIRKSVARLSGTEIESAPPDSRKLKKVGDEFV